MVPIVPIVPKTSVWPSAGARATDAVPTLPPAPGRFSTMTVTPSPAANWLAKLRASVSPPPPGENGATKVMGSFGQSRDRGAGWAVAAEVARAAASATAAHPGVPAKV